eukprot:361840-Chlamydomonas_euryale.AAC.14
MSRGLCGLPVEAAERTGQHCPAVVPWYLQNRAEMTGGKGKGIHARPHDFLLGCKPPTPLWLQLPHMRA